jgi:hypothetical protein
MQGIALHFPAILGIKTIVNKTLLSAHNLSQCFVTFDYVVQGGGKDVVNNVFSDYHIYLRILMINLPFSIGFVATTDIIFPNLNIKSFCFLKKKIS